MDYDAYWAWLEERFDVEDVWADGVSLDLDEIEVEADAAGLDVLSGAFTDALSDWSYGIKEGV